MLLPKMQLQELSVFVRVLQTQLAQLPHNPFLTRQAAAPSERCAEMPSEDAQRRSGAFSPGEHLTRRDSLAFRPRPSCAPIQGSFH